MNRVTLMNRFWLQGLLSLLISIIPGSLSFAQELGLPFLRNFPAQDYKAHPQNFDITPGPDGMVYFANFAGILQYDGHHWRLIPTPETNRINALATDKNGTILCGAYAEPGFLNLKSNGQLEFSYFPSLLPLIRESGKNILAVFPTPAGALFVTDQAVLETRSTKAFIPGEKIVAAFQSGNTLYLQLKNSGLCVYQNQKLLPVKGGQVFSGAFELKAILKHSNGKLLVVTSTQGLYLQDNTGFSPFKTEADALFRSAILSCGIEIRGFGYALGTTRNGVILMDQQGHLRRIINKKAGLNDDYVHKLYQDPHGIVWIALNNGIAMTEIPSTLNYFDEKAGLEGGVQALCRLDGKLYVATYQGLFRYRNEAGAFTRIEGIPTACWTLSVRGNHLLAGCSDGLYQVDGDQTRKLFSGFCLSLAEDQKTGNTTYLGTPDGLYMLSSPDGSPVKIQGLSSGISAIIPDPAGGVWGIIENEKLFRYQAGQAIRYFDTTSGLPETAGAGLALWQQSPVILTRSGVFGFSPGTEQFSRLPLTDSTDTYGDWYSMMASFGPDENWVCSGDQKNLRRLVKNGSVYRSEASVFLPFSDRVFTCCLRDPDGISWFGGPDGLIRFNPDIKNNIDREFRVMIRKITTLNDSVIFWGNTGGSGEQAATPDLISYTNNTIRFEFASPYFTPKGNTLYRFKLEGFDDTWSEWQLMTSKEYTNLPYGTYVFRVEAMNAYGKQSSAASCAFRIPAPWYFTWWAYILYGLIISGILVFFVRLRNHQLVKEKKILEQKIQDRTMEVTRQKEEIEKQSEELSDKNLELEKINTLVKSINSEINFNSLLQSLLEKMRMIRPAERLATLVFDAAQGIFSVKAAFGWKQEDMDLIRLTEAEAEELFLTGSEEVYEDIFLKTHFDNFLLSQGVQPISIPKTMLVVVIKINERIEAYLVLENLIRQDAFDYKDLSFIFHSKEHIIAAFIKTKILEDLQHTLNNLKDAQNQLIQAEKLASLGQLTAGIAHEIQNPLNFVNNFSSLSVGLAKELREYIEEMKEKIEPDRYLDIEEVLGMIEGNVQKIGEHGKRVSSIVRGMLQHSRGRSGEFELVEINTMVEEYTNLAYHGTRAKDSSFNTKITSTLDPAAGKISVVPQDISRVILNIMNNAFYAVSERSKASATGYSPEVSISTKRIDKRVEIRIRDNGTGIPPHVLEKIFNPFFTTKPTGQGTGLGLSLSFDIITQLHKGKLEVNTAEGEFTEFVITLPEKP